MAKIIGLSILWLSCVIYSTTGETKDCSVSYELIKPATTLSFQVNISATKTFYRSTVDDFMIKDDVTGVESRKETCAVILQNGQDTEVIMSFLILDGTTNRFCWKGLLRNYVLFYVTGVPQPSSSGLTTEFCLSQLGSTTSYQMMMKLPLPSITASPPVFNVDMSSVIKPGTYKLTYMFDNQLEKCVTNTISESSIQVYSDKMIFKPCDATVASYNKPFNKELYIAGYVEDTMLDVIRDGGQQGGAFFVLVYYEYNQPFRFYLMRTFQTVSMDNISPSYLEMFGITMDSEAYSPTGYVDFRYVPPDKTNQVLRIRSYSDDCQSNPCLNGGTCINQWLKYICICPASFTGDNCAKLDDECTKNDVNGSLCSYHGVCVPTASSYTCDCFDGYTGPKCEDTTTCLSNSCLNGGTCFDPRIDSVKICDCLPEFYGPSCEFTAVCQNLKPCKNGGTCYDGNNTYICVCPAGFSGTNCDGSEVSAPVICVEGINDICLNGGVCINGRCVCQTYYTGTYCEDINNWFIGSVVLIVLMAVVMVVTLIVCCFFCARGSTLGMDGNEKFYDPFTYGVQQNTKSTSGYAPDGFTANRFPDPAFYNDGYTSRF